MEGTCSYKLLVNNMSNTCKTAAGNKRLSVIYYNVRSILPKLDELSLLAKTHNPDVICIVEPWLSADISDPEIAIPGYYAHRLDRNRNACGGGVFSTS